VDVLNPDRWLELGLVGAVLFVGLVAMLRSMQDRKTTAGTTDQLVKILGQLAQANDEGNAILTKQAATLEHAIHTQSSMADLLRVFSADLAEIKVTAHKAHDETKAVRFDQVASFTTVRDDLLALKASVNTIVDTIGRVADNDEKWDNILTMLKRLEGITRATSDELARLTAIVREPCEEGEKK
jgi:ABC-type transporter Mla subunit MlaD